MATLVLDAESEDPRLIHLDKQSTLIGKASDADVRLENERLADHHARIEHKEDGYYLIDLQGGSETFVNGESITFQKLKHGDRLKFGDINAVIMLEEEGALDYDIPITTELNSETLPVHRTTSFVARNNYRDCPQCGFSVTENMVMCPQCGQALSKHAVMQSGFIQPTPTNLAGPGILPVIAFLAALSVIGAPVALVLGLITLSVIRRHGGTIRDHRMAKWSIGLGLVWIMVGLVAAAGVVQKAKERKQLDAQEVYEAKVIRALKNLACAQKYAHTIEYCDADLDGHGEYGDLSVLAEMNSPFFDSDLAAGEAYGYRFTVREASEGRFLAVAEPVRYKDTGIRTFAIDRSGQIRGGDASGKRFAQIGSPLPVLQGERSAYYEIDDEIAKDVLNYVKSLSATLVDQEKKQRILARLRTDYSLTTVGRELEGMKATVDRFVTEQRAQAIYLEAQAALAEESQDVALSKLMEIQEEHASFSKIAAVERELSDLRSMIAQGREEKALKLFHEAEELERLGERPQEVQQLYQRIEKLYPETDVAVRVVSLKPELQRQLRERNAEDIFSDLMELSPESEYGKILNLVNQLRRNYNDTALFGKVMKELEKKERKARASSWRSRTVQSIEEGRVRGALAQLESAAEENPDLMYDLRDLYIQLYRSVAKKLVEEGDARAALVYYERLNRLLRSSDLKGQEASPELLAKLHNDVGQADYERKAYKEAQWHLSCAAWNYKEDASFSMRFGVASLYTGLYQLAEVALTQALHIRPDMEPALLYRSYLNMRKVLALEQAVAGGFQEVMASMNIEVEGARSESEEERPSGNNYNITIEDDGGSEDRDITLDLPEEDTPDYVLPNKNLNYSRNDQDWSFRFATSNEKRVVPGPKDIDLVMHYDYSASQSILPDSLMFLQELKGIRGEFARELRDARGAGAESLESVKLGQLMQLSELRNQLSKMRTRHLEDVAAWKELCRAMEEMKKCADAATLDIKGASEKQQLIQSLARQVLPQLEKKRTLLFKAVDLIAGSMEDEVKMREKVLRSSESILRKSTSSSAGTSDVTRTIKNLFRKTSSTEKVDRALLALRDSMEVRVDLNGILRAAEGNMRGGRTDL